MAKREWERMSTLWDMFRSKAEATGASVQGAASEAAAAELVAASAPAPAGTRTLSERFPRVAERCAAPVTARAPASDVAAAAAFAVAETGSVAIVEAHAADRGACFLAERLWLLVPGNEIESTLDAALQRVASLVREGARYVTLMSGPSRTADIERVLTIGVHGPREVTIVVVGEGAPV